MIDTKIVAIIVLCFTVLMYAFGAIESKYACQTEKQQIQMLLEQKEHFADASKKIEQKDK